MGSSEILRASTGRLKRSFVSCSERGLHRGRVARPRVSSYLTFPPLPRSRRTRRYISVALFLGSPPAAVSRYSCPVELGLSSDAHFRTAPATVRPAHMFLFYGTSAILSIHRISNLHRMKKAMLKTGYLSAYPYRTRLQKNKTIPRGFPCRRCHWKERKCAGTDTPDKLH